MSRLFRLDKHTSSQALQDADAPVHLCLLCVVLQSWGDEDIPDVLDSIAETLREQAVHVSSWDKYKKEVLSGTLDWTPMHTSEVFWRNNVDKFEDKDFQLLRVLLKLLETSRDPRTQVCGMCTTCMLGKG